MALIVQKFGGTSVGTVERIEAVADKIIDFHERGDDIVVVVSAMSGETNRLTALAKDIMEYPTPREMDVLLSTGEQVTIALLSMALEKRGFGARSFTGGQVKILTCETHTKARIREIDGTRIHAQLEPAMLWLLRAFRVLMSMAVSPHWVVAVQHDGCGFSGGTGRG